MIKMISGALVGVLIIILGIFVWYMYMTTFISEGNHSLFALSMIQIGIGVYILFRASKSTEVVVSDDIIRPSPVSDTETQSVDSQNTSLLKE